jgi:hypothetical protein
VTTSAVLVSRSYERLALLSWRLTGARWAVTLVHATRPIADACSCAMRADVLLVDLTGDENVAEIRTLLVRFPGARLLLTVPAMPPAAAIARLCRAHGALVLDAGAADVVTTAALFALAANDPVTEAHA